MKLTDQDGSFVRWNHRQSEILFSKVQVTKQNAQGGLTLFACLRCFLSDFSTISYHSHIFNSRFVGRVFPFLMQISETMWIMAIGTEMFFEIFSEMYILMSSSTVDTWACLNMGMPSGHRTSQWEIAYKWKVYSKIIGT